MSLPVLVAVATVATVFKSVQNRQSAIAILVGSCSKKGRPVPHRRLGQHSGKAECLNELEPTNQHGFKRERPGR